MFTLNGTAQSGSPSMLVSDGLSAVGDNSTFVFNSTEVGSSSGVALTVRNNGSGTLTFTGSPRVIVSGASSGDFEASLGASSLAPGGFAILTMEFNPSAEGARNARIIINCNDTNLTDAHVSTGDNDEDPDYIINLNGTGTVTPDIIVKDNSGGFVEIPYGGSVTMPITAVGASNSYFFGVDNAAGEIILAPVREERVLLEGTNADDWNIFYYPVEEVITGPGSEAIGMSFNPSFDGFHTTQVLIPSNDPDENPFVFTMTGLGVDLSLKLDSDLDGFTDSIEKLFETDEDNENDKPAFGDYSGDGATDLEDAVALGRATIGGALSPYDADLDIDADGDVDFTDATILYSWSINEAPYHVIPYTAPAMSLAPTAEVELRRLIQRK